jgi:hypothetical protein
MLRSGLCGLQSRHAHVANLILAHQSHRVAGENPRAIEAPAVQDHPLEAHVSFAVDDSPPPPLKVVAGACG